MAYRFKTRSVVPGAQALKAAALTHVAGYAAVTDVESDVTYGTAGTEYTGTFAVPAEADVESDVTYGAGGVEFTGTLAPGGGGGSRAVIV